MRLACRGQIKRRNAHRIDLSTYEKPNSALGYAKIDDASLRSMPDAASQPNIAKLRDKRSTDRPICASRQGQVAPPIGFNPSVRDPQCRRSIRR